MLKVLDIGIGNIGSVSNVLNHLGVTFEIAKTPQDLENATKIIFPGVGSYSEGAKTLNSEGFTEIIQEKVLNQKVPILGICLGMQLLTSKGFEGGETPGLNLIDGEVIEIILDNKDLHIPHMGWNSTKGDTSKVFDNIEDGECFYFVHSYECKINDPAVKVGYTNHGRDIVSSFNKDNVYGVQFHPEKSQEKGLQLLKNFIELC